MTPDEARELFSEALEDELGPRKEAFDAALAGDADLSAEYADFVSTIRGGLAALAQADAEDAPDLVHGVQERLRRRSRGRYYSDRFAQRAGPGWVMPVMLVVAMLVVLGVAWIVVQTSILMDEAPSAAQRPRE